MALQTSTWQFRLGTRECGRGAPQEERVRADLGSMDLNGRLQLAYNLRISNLALALGKRATELDDFELWILRGASGPAPPDVLTELVRVTFG